MKRREALATLGGAALIGPALLSCKKRSTIMKKEIKTGKAPEAIGPYSQARNQNRQSPGSYRPLFTSNRSQWPGLCIRPDRYRSYYRRAK